MAEYRITQLRGHEIYRVEWFGGPTSEQKWRTCKKLVAPIFDGSLGHYKDIEFQSLASAQAYIKKRRLQAEEQEQRDLNNWDVVKEEAYVEV